MANDSNAFTFQDLKKIVDAFNDKYLVKDGIGFGIGGSQHQTRLHMNAQKETPNEQIASIKTEVAAFIEKELGRNMPEDFIQVRTIESARFLGR